MFQSGSILFCSHYFSSLVFFVSLVLRILHQTLFCGDGRRNFSMHLARRGMFCFCFLNNFLPFVLASIRRQAFCSYGKPIHRSFNDVIRHKRQMFASSQTMPHLEGGMNLLAGHLLGNLLRKRVQYQMDVSRCEKIHCQSVKRRKSNNDFSTIWM